MTEELEILCQCGHKLDEHELCGCESWLIFDDTGTIIGTKVDGDIHHDCFGFIEVSEISQPVDNICWCSKWRPDNELYGVSDTH